MRIVTYLAINALAVFVADYLLKGVYVDSIITALIVAILLGIVNTVLKPILVILTLPITIITLGLFYFVINAFLVLFVSKLVPGFVVSSLFWAILFSLIISIISWFLEQISGR